MPASVSTIPKIIFKEKSYSKLREVFAHANSFEWDETVYPTDGQCKNPNKFLTPSCFWAMTCSQFFPHSAYYFATDDEANDALMEDVKAAIKNEDDCLPAEDEMVDELDQLMSKTVETDQERAIN